MTLPLILLGAGVIGCVVAGISLWRQARRPVGRPLPVAIVVGSSMAETLHGETVVGTCPACGHSLRFAIESLPRVGDVLCPNCGEPIDPNGLDLRRGDRVAIRSLSPGETPQTDRLYVFAATEEETAEPIVKRVVAGPGKRVSIADGDLFLDGERVRKNPSGADLPRIVVHEGDSLWSKESTANADQAYVFHPETIWSVEPHPVPVLDAYPSQATERRRLNAVSDVWAVGRLESNDPPDVEFTYDAGERTYSLAVSTAGAWSLRLNDSETALGEGKLPDWSTDESFRFGMLDRQIFLVRPGRSSIVVPLDKESDFLPSTAPLAITIPATAKLTGLRVERDVHYLPPIPGKEPWTEPAGAASAGWFLLGDYPAYSIDSRQFGRLSRETLLGEALLPPIEEAARDF
jgi:type IV secretory pathway protease TraF